MTKVYDRHLKKVVEVKHFGGNTLNKIYKNKILTKITTSHLISKCYGIYNGSKWSRKKIEKFIKENQIDMNLYQKEDYACFNDFFIRKLKKVEFDTKKDHLTSPVQGYLLAYPIKENLTLKVKECVYTLDELFDGENLSNYKNGVVLIFRLALNNYHHFHHIDDGKCIKRKVIKGRLHTVSDSSKSYKIYQENAREYSVLKTKNFGEMIYMEVGALLVGKIINYNDDTFTRGMDKGYFLPGGSTVILVLNHVKVDSDILEHSKKNMETKVEVGEKVGVVKC